MFDSHTLQLLRNKLPALPQFAAERSLARDIDDLVAGVFPGMALAVVDDQNTALLGDSIYKALKGATRITLHVPVTADDAAVEEIRQRSKRADALVAVGSGTINDLCKYAAHLDGKPYLVFPTAASMNGYCSANASITVKGYKKTVAAQMPKAVFCDLSVIAAAPARLSKSGLGDALARPTAQADWLLSHLLLGTPYDALPFTLLEKLEPQLFAHARGIALADPGSISLLLQLSLLSGLGMTIAGGSYPASQAEHMVAHSYNMLQERQAPPAIRTLHGEEIAVTALALSRRQETLLSMEPELLEPAFPSERIASLYGKKIATESAKSYALKQELIKTVLRQKTELFSGWDGIAGQIHAIHMPSAEIASILAAAECPTEPEHIGWNRNDYMQVSSTARYLRERFTFLDLT